MAAMALDLLLLCALIAVVVSLVRSMLRHWEVWLGAGFLAAVLLLVFNLWYYGGKA